MGFNKIYYQGKELKRDNAATTRTIVMQKNNPDRLDMRYKTNREWTEEQKVISKITPVKGSDWQGMETVDVKTSIPLFEYKVDQDDSAIDILTSTPSIYKPIQADDPHNTLGEDILATGTWK